MKTIRNNVFETNSSSMHSITFSNTDIKDITPCITEVELTGTGEYGWEYSNLTMPEELGDYILIAYTWMEKDDDVYQNYRAKLIDYFAEKGVKLTLPEHITDITGYIDHQSAPGESDDCRFLATFVTDPENFFRFIFAKDSYIITDNDNH